MLKGKKIKLFEMLKESETMVRLAITFLTYEHQEFLKSILGAEYNGYLNGKLNQTEKIKRRTELVLNYLKSSNITEEQAKEFLEGKNTKRYILLKMNFQPNVKFYDTEGKENNKEMQNFINDNFKNNSIVTIEYLRRNNITPNDIPLLLNSPSLIKYIESESKNNYCIATSTKSFYSRFNEDKELVLLASKLLKDKEKLILYKKHDENLESMISIQLTNKENSYFYNIIIPSMKNILTYLKTNNITVIRAKYLLSSDGKEELELLMLAYYQTKQRKEPSTPHKYKSILDSFNKPKNIIKLSIMLLKEEYQHVIFQIYGITLEETKTQKITTKTINRITYAKKLIKQIIEFLESKNITEEQTLYLMSKEGATDLENLKKEYYESNIKKHTKGNRKYYKSFFSYFSDPKHIIKFSVLFLKEDHRNLLYFKYNKDLENIIPKEEANEGITSIIYNTVLPKIKEIIEFLNKENITDKHIDYLCSENGKEDLKVLIDIYRTQKRLNSFKKVMFKESETKRYSNEEKIQTLFKRNEGKININRISEIFDIEKEEVFDAYIAYKLENKKTRARKQ